MMGKYVYNISTPHTLYSVVDTREKAYTEILNYISDGCIDAVPMRAAELNRTYELNEYHFGVTGLIWCDLVEDTENKESEEKGDREVTYINKTQFNGYMRNLMSIIDTENETVNKLVELFGSGGVEFADNFRGITFAIELLEKLVGDTTHAIDYFANECDCDFNTFSRGIDEDLTIENFDDLYDYIVLYCREVN